MTKGNYLLGRKLKDIEDKKIYDFVEFEDRADHKKDDIKTYIFDISAAKDYILALDNNYRVWGWGSNKFKQINYLNEDKEFTEPRLLTSLKKNVKKFINL
jgi:alpha-tubulin suppressor-like RCC1 family protein